MKSLSFLVPLGVALALLFATPELHAQDDRVAYADRLFNHGVELMKNDNCSAAVPEFLDSQRLDPSAATLANLATCYARLGRRASAWKTYREAAALAASEGNPTLRGQALSAMSRLSPSLTKLRIVPPNDIQAVSLRLNGEPLDHYDGVPIPLDSGESVIEAFAPGHQPWRRTVNASEVGATLVIEVPELTPTDKQEGVDLRPHAVIVAGVGVAMLVVGSVLGLSAKQSDDQAASFCRQGHCTSEGVALREQAVSKATAATYVAGLGLVATGTGVALWFASKPPDPPFTTEGVHTERFDSGELGISWSGKF